MSNYSSIIEAAEKFLREKKAFGPSNSQSSKAVISHVREATDIGVTDGTILNYVSNAANNDDESNIISGGSHGGYWVDISHDQEPTLAEPEIENQTIESKKGAPVTVSEMVLYPLVELWLAKKGYTSKDLSRLKSGGKWGNPDIIGVGRWEVFGEVELEFASCEVKISESNWEQVIFEAISHKRFSNRSWFCFRTNGKEILPAKMEYYAERYRVGIVSIAITDDELLKLKDKLLDPIDLIDKVVEVIPALYDQVPLREKAELVQRTQVTLNASFEPG